jgi:hypothetical protein
MVKIVESIEPDLTSLETKLVAVIGSDRKIRDDADKRIKKNEELLRAVRGALSGSGDAQGYGSKTTNLLAAIDKISKPRFGMADVETVLNALGTPFKKAVLRTGLWTLADKGKIKVVRKGTNSAPAEYEKTSNNNSE